MSLITKTSNWVLSYADQEQGSNKVTGDVVTRIR